MTKRKPYARRNWTWNRRRLALRLAGYPEMLDCDAGALRALRELSLRAASFALHGRAPQYFGGGDR